jgi:glutathione peroxidase
MPTLGRQVAHDMTLLDTPIAHLDGKPGSLGEHAGKALLLVNVASKCGLTPQYTGLEELQRTYGERGFTVLGFPCNQFGGQEPGSAEEIATFCSATYGVSFPLYEKIDVNGESRHPLYEQLTAVPDANGKAGDIQWNFEKFLVSPTGEVVGRFRPRTEPQDPELVASLEAQLPG